MSKRWPDKVVVGLTGNIATGKSAVMKMAAEHDALTLDADRLVHEILAEDEDIHVAIVAEFGKQVQAADGAIDRSALGDIVFRDEAKLRRLEQIIHPAVRQRLHRHIERSSAQVVFIEAIKLLEGGLARECDQVWVTRCPRELQVQRLVICRGLDEAGAHMRINAQTPQAEKVAQADVVIDTSGTMATTQAYFDLAWRRLTRDLPSSLQAAPAPQSGAVERDADVLVRRARPADIPAILLLLTRATDGRFRPSRHELLAALGERGYLIGQRGTTISTVAGWRSEDQIAHLDQFYVHPPSAASETGAAVLDEILSTARGLLCEVVLAFVRPDAPRDVLTLFRERDFAPVDSATLPRAWQRAARSGPADCQLWSKTLRDLHRR